MRVFLDGEPLDPSKIGDAVESMLREYRRGDSYAIIDVVESQDCVRAKIVVGAKCLEVECSRSEEGCSDVVAAMQELEVDIRGEIAGLVTRLAGVGEDKVLESDECIDVFDEDDESVASICFEIRSDGDRYHAVYYSLRRVESFVKRQIEEYRRLVKEIDTIVSRFPAKVLLSMLRQFGGEAVEMRIDGNELRVRLPIVNGFTKARVLGFVVREKPVMVLYLT